IGFSLHLLWLWLPFDFLKLSFPDPYVVSAEVAKKLSEFGSYLFPTGYISQDGTTMVLPFLDATLRGFSLGEIVCLYACIGLTILSVALRYFHGENRRSVKELEW